MLFRSVIDVVLDRVREGHNPVVVCSWCEPNRLRCTVSIKGDGATFRRLRHGGDTARGTESVDVVRHDIVSICSCVFVDRELVIDGSKTILDGNRCGWQDDLGGVQVHALSVMQKSRTATSLAWITTSPTSILRPAM